MNKGPYLLLIAGISWLLVSIGVYILTKDLHLILSLVSSIIFTILVIAGFRNREEWDSDELDRPMAMSLSVVPGFGQIYLGRWKGGLILLLLLFVVLSSFASMFFVDVSYVMVIAFATMMGGGALMGWSVIDVDEICTEIGLEEDELYTLNIKNHRRAKIIWASISVTMEVIIICSCLPT